MQLLGFFKTVRDLSEHQPAQISFPLAFLRCVSCNAKLNVQSVTVWLSKQQGLVVLLLSWYSLQPGQISYLKDGDLRDSQPIRKEQVIFTSQRLMWRTVSFPRTVWDTFGPARTLHAAS